MEIEQLAAERPEFGEDLRAWLKDFVAENC